MGVSLVVKYLFSSTTVRNMLYLNTFLTIDYRLYYSLFTICIQVNIFQGQRSGYKSTP